jgi:dienelactone hydrolase
MFLKSTLFVLCALVFTPNGFAAMKTETIEYPAQGAIMEGFVAYDDAKKEPMTGIIIVPDWKGVGDFAKEKAKKLASEGYVAFVADVYGKGVRPKDNADASKEANKYLKDRPKLRDHAKAAYDKLLTMKEVNSKKVVAVGYCFGGAAALELARMGTPLAGVVTFHGNLSNPTPEDAKNIHAKVLVLHGADDPNVNPQVPAFKKEMKAAHVDLEFISYPGAVHAFTDPASGNDNSTGVAYNADADKKSWAAFEKFLKDLG